MACVELNEWLAGDERIVLEAVIEPRILDDQRIVVQDCMGAERHRPGCLRRRQPVPGFEPLTRGIDKRHDNDRHVKEQRSRSGNAVKTFFWRSIEKVQRAQGIKSLCFVVRYRCHRASSNHSEFGNLHGIGRLISSAV